MVLRGHENPRNCVDPDKTKMSWCLSTPGSPKYVLPIAGSTSVTPVSRYTRGHSWMMYLEAVIEQVERCTWRPRSSELRDALGGQDRVNSEIHSEAMIKRVWRCTWRPRLSELSDALGGRDWVNSETHLEAVIERVWRCAARPQLSKFGLSVWGDDRARLEMQLKTEIEWTERWKTGWEPETGWERETVHHGMMLYLMYAVLGVKSWSWHGEIERDVLTSCT